MTLAVGVDLIELARIERAVERHGERFLSRVYTANELERFRSRLPELAARFAAKEAVSKALGVGLRHLSPHGIRWHDVEVLSESSGKPRVFLSGRALELSRQMGLKEWDISLSHSQGHALAFFVASA